MSTTKPVTRHPLSIAWDEWLESDEGQQCRAANTLAHNTNVYLENRLHRAFDAGAKAATPADLEQLAALRTAAQLAMLYFESDPQATAHGREIAAALRNALGLQGGGSDG